MAELAEPRKGIEMGVLDDGLRRQWLQLTAENARLRVALERIQDGLRAIDDADHVDTVGRAREIALAALNQ